MKNLFLAKILGHLLWTAAALTLATAARAKMPAPQAILPEDQYAFVAYVLKKAAYDFGNVKAQEKTIQANRQSEIGAALNTLTVSASLGHTKSSTGYAGAGPSSTFSQGSITNLATVSAQFQVSLATFFQLRGIELTRETQKSALAALRMQNATEAAQAFLSYDNAYDRIALLQAFVTILTQVQEDPKSFGSLSASSKTLLTNLIDTYSNQVASQQSAQRAASFDLEKYIGPEAVRYLETVLKKASEKARARSPVGQKGLDWATLDRIFPVPSTLDAALEKTRGAPALVQAELAEKSARNQWYLSIAGVGPQLLVSVTHYSGNAEISLLGQSLKGGTHSDTVLGSVGVQFGAGAFNNMDANRLLTQAARLSTGAVQDGIRAQLQKLYNTLDSSRVQLVTADKRIGTFATSAPLVKPITDSELSTLTSLLQNVDQFSQQLETLFTSYIMTRIQIHALTGTLLEQIDSLATIDPALK